MDKKDIIIITALSCFFSFFDMGEEFDSFFTKEREDVIIELAKEINTESIDIARELLKEYLDKVPASNTKSLN